MKVSETVASFFGSSLFMGASGTVASSPTPVIAVAPFLASAPTSFVQAASTPRVSIRGPATVVLGHAARFTASTAGSAGPGRTYRWTIDGRAAGSGATLTHAFSRPGKTVVGLQVDDAAGNMASATHTVTVSLPRLRIALGWSVRHLGTSVSVLRSLVAKRVPVGTHVVLACTGGGCPFRTRSVVIRAACAHGHCRSRPRDVNLTPLLRSARLTAGARLAVRFQKRLWTARLFRFTFGAHRPRVTVSG